MSALNPAGQNKIVKGDAHLKKVGFYLVMILLPVLFFILLEAGLRAAGYGESYPLFVPVEGYPDYLRPNPDVAGRYFETIENLPGIPFDSFKSRKDTASFRIFVQGGSTAAGFPFYFGGSFPDMLEQRLLQTFPGRTIEVINTAMAAVNSHTLADFVDEVIAQDPDLVLIYAGHNEYYGALGVGSSESLGRSPQFVRLYLKLRRFRVVQGLRSLLAGVVGAISGARTSDDDSGGTLMKRMVGEQRIPFGSDLFKAGLRQFEYNLSDILARYKGADVPVLIGTVVSNERDQRPFISGLSPSTNPETYQGRMQTIMAHVARADTSAALSGIRQLIATDSLAATTFYLEAKLLDRPGSYDRARSSYKRAKDRDELRFRAPEEINRIIREAAEGTGAIVVDTESAVAADSESGIPGANVMTEHLHPNIQGYFLLADAFYDAMRTARLIGDWTQAIGRDVARRELLVTSIDSIAGAYRVQSLQNSWPFQPIGAPKAALDTIAAGTVEGRLGLAIFQRDMRRVDALEELHRHYLRSGRLIPALQSLLSIIQRYPFLAQPYLAAGDVLMRMGRYEEALEYVLASLDRETSATGLRMAGSLLVQRGRHSEAVPYLRGAVELEPENLQALYNLAGAYALSRQSGQARAVARRILQIYPDHADTQRLLQSLPE